MLSSPVFGAGAPEERAGSEARPAYLLGAFPRRVWSTSRETYTGWSLVILAAAGGLVPVIDDYDGEVRAEIRRGKPLGDAVEAGDALGLPQTLFGVSAAVAAGGWLAGSEPALETGRTMLEAASVAGLSTIALKLAARRRRPDGSNRLSFPSNHASGSFALATVVAGRHGWIAGVPAFAAAGFVSASRLEADKHFLSDSLFGAVLGAVVGLAALEVRGEEVRDGRVVWEIAPMGGGLALRAEW